MPRLNSCSGPTYTVLSSYAPCTFHLSYCNAIGTAVIFSIKVDYNLVNLWLMKPILIHLTVIQGESSMHLTVIQGESSSTQ